MIEVETTDIEVQGSDVEVVVNDTLDVTISKKEFIITGDDIYVPVLYDDAPQWMKDLVELSVSVGIETNNTELVSEMTKMLSEFAVSYVPLNQYTQTILSINDETSRLNAVLETLNSNFSDELSEANAQIKELQLTKAGKDEVVAEIITTIAAQLANPSSDIGATVNRLDQAIATETNARAVGFEALTASLESVDGDVVANAQALRNTMAYVGVNEAGASTETGLSAYLEKNGVVGSADSKVANSVYTDNNGNVKSKYEYGSTLVVNGRAHNSGFGLVSGTSTGTTTNINGTNYPVFKSKFWVKADEFEVTNGTTGHVPFRIEGNKIKFNGEVSFDDITDKPPLVHTPQEVIDAVNTGNTTTINGGRLTTGSVTAKEIKANSVSADRLTSTNGQSTIWTGGGLVSSNFNGNVNGNIGNPTTGFRLSSNAAGTSTDPNIYGAYMKASFIESLYSPVPGTDNYGDFNFSAYATGGASVGAVGPGYGSGYNRNRVTSLQYSNIIIKGFRNISTNATATWDVTGNLQRSINGGAYQNIQTKRMYFNLPPASGWGTDTYSVRISISIGGEHASDSDSGWVQISITVEPTMAMETTLEFYHVEDLSAIGNFNTISYRIPNGTTFLTINN